jgi:cysteine-rich repeat protein
MALSRLAVGLLPFLVVIGAPSAKAQPSSNLDDYVLFAEQSIRTKGLRVADGDIGVNQSGGRLDAPKFPAIAAPNSTVASDIVRIDESSQCMELFANTVIRTGPSCGPAMPFVTPIIADLQAACGFPDPFPACNPANPVVVKPGETRVLAPGVYGNVFVKSGSFSGVVIPGTLELTGGVYVFCNLRAGRNSRILFDSASVVNVVGIVNIGNNTFTGPAPGSGITADDIRFFVNGGSVHFSRISDVVMRLCAPFAKLKVTKGASLTGNFFAFQIRTEEIFFPICGDFVVQGRETCDPPGSDPPPPGGNLCRTDCTYCGDARIQLGEQCDDGNNVDDDICHNNCTFNQPPGCGNGVIVMPNETCEPPGSDPPPPGGNLCRINCTYCGDGIVNSGEQCDDGNTIDNDFCHNDCTSPSPPLCGNIVINPGETCDPPGSDPPPPGGNLCRTDCTYCGDGITNDGEQCDDGNTIDTDGCHNDCTFNPSLCGNFVLNPGETCDPPGSDPPPLGGNLCRTDCTYCGDGITNDGETCDDGNTIDGDACPNDCTIP